MEERERIFEEIRNCTNPASIKEEWEHESIHTVKVKNIFTFMQFCWNRKITPENSVTWYDECEGYMYIKFPFIRCS